MRPPGWARERLAAARLYAILDTGYTAWVDFLPMARQLVNGGADVLQLRAKEASPLALAQMARAVHEITAPAGVPLIVNDHPEAARESGAEGVHVGQDDLSVPEARAMLARPDGIVGKSTHSLAQARESAREGADYIGFGPLFPTPTKPDYAPVGLRDIAQAVASAGRPVFCIGGIKSENLPTVLAAGAERVVVVSGILTAPDPAGYCRALKRVLGLRPA